MKTYGNYSCNYHSKPSEMGTMFTNLNQGNKHPRIFGEVMLIADGV
jgi:hypothetical protein